MLTPTVQYVPASARMASVSHDTFGDFSPAIVNRPTTLTDRPAMATLAPTTFRSINRTTI